MTGPWVTQLLVDIARELDWEVTVEPDFGYVFSIRLPDGRTRFARTTTFDLNGAGATEVACDKDYAAFFLSHFGFPIPEGRAFYTAEWAETIGSDRNPAAAREFAASLGWPVIVKPNSQSQGAGVQVVRVASEFHAAVTVATKRDRVFLVQRQLEGLDYRVVVLDGTVVSAYQRKPLSILGDGAMTARDLLLAKQVAFESVGRDTKIKLDDPRIATELRQRQFDLESVIPKDLEMILLPNANLSSGGDAIDVTERVHPEWVAIARSIAAAMNLRYIGIDIMSKQPLESVPGPYTVLEVNASPGLDNYSSIGPEQAKRVRDMYRRVLLALAE